MFKPPNKSRLHWCMAAVVSLAVPMLSGAAGAEEPYQPGWREVWTGADATGHVWLVYSGATVAHASQHL